MIILATDMGLIPKTTTTTIYIKISDKPTNIFRLSTINQYDSSNEQLSTTFLTYFNMDTNKFIIICIILITFIICTVLISVIFTISRNNNNNSCNVFNHKATVTTKPITAYNENTHSYHTNLVEKSPPDIINVTLPSKSINYPFDCIDVVNTFERNNNNNNYLPTFYEQTTSMTLPYTFHETDLRFYDQLMPANEELLNG